MRLVSPLVFRLTPYALLLTFVMVLPAGATTYYVSPSGNDVWRGMRPDSAWRHVNRACTTVVAGDSVLVLSGTYPERVVLRRSGTASRKIVFKSSPRRTATTWGFDTNSPASGSYTRIEGFNVVWDTSLTGWRDRYGVFVSSDYAEVVDNYFSFLRGPGVQGNWSQPLPRGAYVADNRVYHCQAGLGISGTAWTVERNEVDFLFQYGRGDCDYSRFFGDSLVIRRNYFHGTVPESIGSAHVDAFQTFDNNGERARWAVIEANSCWDFHQGFMGEAHFYHQTSDLTFKNNLFARGWAWGLCVQDIARVRALNNTFAYIQWHGIGFSGQYCQGGEVRNNIFYNTNTSYWWADTAQASGDYNLIMGASAPTTRGPHDLLGQDPRFVDSLANNFRLQSSSPARDAGDSLLEVREDILGTLRPQGPRWDIGAYEYIVTGMEESSGTFYPLSSNLSFSVFPNPFTSFAAIPGHSSERFALYDIAGRKVGTYKGDRIGEGLSPGVYFLKPDRKDAKPLRIVKLR